MRDLESHSSFSDGYQFHLRPNEWRFTNTVRDHGRIPATCQLCQQENLRYHFEILNQVTGQTLWVGSSCILRFNLPVYEGSKRLSEEEVKKTLARSIRDVQARACMTALKALADSEENSILTRALADYETKGWLTPKQAAVVFWKLKAHCIEHHASFFKVNLSRRVFQEQLQEMESFKVRCFWEALTHHQRNIAASYGHHYVRSGA